ncbi:hypothetical protein Tco_1173391 [Tanacetum coccineum]
MQAACDRQKSYADLKRKPMEFQVGDKVLEKVGEVAYKLEVGRLAVLTEKCVHKSIALPLRGKKRKELSDLLAESGEHRGQ